jgi:hypothetical protein
MINTYQHQSKYDRKKLRSAFPGSDDEKRCSALVTMMYLTMSIANAYLEEAKDILQQYAVYEFDTKAECEAAIQRFDRYHDRMKRYFKGEPLAQGQLCEVYEMLKQACDEQILESIAQYNRKVEQGEYQR